jgi:acyl-CoA thioester hydrolase
VKPHSSRLDVSAYPHRVEIQTRFSDLDPRWHLNNVRLMEIYQEARSSFNMAMWKGLKLDARTHRLLVASQSIDYLHEVEWPGCVTLGVGITRLGTKSYSLGLGMFQRGICAGVSETVLVYATQTGSAPLPENLREALKEKLLPQTDTA